MSTRVPEFVALDRSLDGARILVRQFLSQRPGVEKWVKEFTADGVMVRLSDREKASDAGAWHRVYDLRVEAVLDAAKAPPSKEPRADAGESDYRGDVSGQMGLGGGE